MLTILKGSKPAFVASAAAFILLGVAMCAWPTQTASVLCVAAGVALAAGGVWRLISYFRGKDYSLFHRWDFATGALQTILGLLLVRRPTVIVEMIPMLLGVMVLVNSVFQLQVAFSLKRLGYGAWWYHLAVALVCALTALVMMFNPYRSYELLSILMGAAFIVDGLADLWTALFVTRNLKKMNLM